MKNIPEISEELAKITADYRVGELPAPTAAHVQKWLGQFDAGIQLPLLTELVHVLNHTYIPKVKVEAFLSNLVLLPKLATDKPNEFWSGVKFLDIQRGGRSQHEMLAMFGIHLQQKTGLVLANCGANDPKTFVYLDDGLYTGNRILNDLRDWLKTAPNEAKLHVIVIANHTGGTYYLQTNFAKAKQDAKKDISVSWWHLIELEDRKSDINTSDVLRPRKLPDDERTKKYAATLKFPPIFRSADGTGKLNLFSSETGRDLLEQQFLMKGALIRENSPQLPETHRPLGNMVLSTLGFGSTIVTYRNCPNNAPLALWAGNPWYPLFARKTN
jgi:hypothetical protein